MNFPGGKTCFGFHFSVHLSANTLYCSHSPPPHSITLWHVSFPYSSYFRLLPYLSISLPIIPSSLFLLPSLSMDNSSVLLRAAVCLPAYCDFHWDSFRDHSHLDWELEPRLQREINHTHLILTRIHEHTYTQKTFNFALFSPPKYSDFFVLTVFYFKLSDMHTCLFMHHTF